MINLNLNYILFIVYVFVTAKFHFLPFLFHEKLRNYARFRSSIRSLPLKVSNCTSNSHLKINTIGMIEWKEDVRLKNWGRKARWSVERGQVNALGDRDARSFARIYARVRVRRTNPGKLRKDTTIDSENYATSLLWNPLASARSRLSPRSFSFLIDPSLSPF